MKAYIIMDRYTTEIEGVWTSKEKLLAYLKVRYPKDKNLRVVDNPNGWSFSVLNRNSHKLRWSAYDLLLVELNPTTPYWLTDEYLGV